MNRQHLLNIAKAASHNNINNANLRVIPRLPHIIHHINNYAKSLHPSVIPQLMEELASTYTSSDHESRRLLRLSYIDLSKILSKSQGNISDAVSEISTLQLRRIIISILNDGVPQQRKVHSSVNIDIDKTTANTLEIPIGGIPQSINAESDSALHSLANILAVGCYKPKDTDEVMQILHLFRNYTSDSIGLRSVIGELSNVLHKRHMNAVTPVQLYAGLLGIQHMNILMHREVSVVMSALVTKTRELMLLYQYHDKQAIHTASNDSRVKFSTAGNANSSSSSGKKLFQFAMNNFQSGNSSSKMIAKDLTVGSNALPDPIGHNNGILSSSIPYKGEYHELTDDKIDCKSAFSWNLTEKCITVLRNFDTRCKSVREMLSMFGAMIDQYYDCNIRTSDKEVDRKTGDTDRILSRMAGATAFANPTSQLFYPVQSIIQGPLLVNRLARLFTSLKYMPGSDYREIRELFHSLLKCIPVYDVNKGPFLLTANNVHTLFNGLRHMSSEFVEIQEFLRVITPHMSHPQCGVRFTDGELIRLVAVCRHLSSNQKVVLEFYKAVLARTTQTSPANASFVYNAANMTRNNHRGASDSLTSSSGSRSSLPENGLSANSIILKEEYISPHSIAKALLSLQNLQPEHTVVRQLLQHICGIIDSQLGKLSNNLSSSSIVDRASNNSKTQTIQRPVENTSSNKPTISNEVRIQGLYEKMLTLTSTSGSNLFHQLTIPLSWNRRNADSTLSSSHHSVSTSAPSWRHIAPSDLKTHTMAKRTDSTPSMNIARLNETRTDSRGGSAAGNHLANKESPVFTLIDIACILHGFKSLDSRYGEVKNLISVLLPHFEKTFGYHYDAYSGAYVKKQSKSNRSISDLLAACSGTLPNNGLVDNDSSEILSAWSQTPATNYPSPNSTAAKNLTALQKTNHSFAAAQRYLSMCMYGMQQLRNTDDGNVQRLFDLMGAVMKELLLTHPFKSTNSKVHVNTSRNETDTDISAVFPAQWDPKLGIHVT